MRARSAQVVISILFLVAGVALVTYATTRYWTTAHVSDRAVRIVEAFLVKHSLYIDLNRPESANSIDPNQTVESRSMLGRIRAAGGMYHWWNDGLPYWGLGAFLISVGCLLPAVRIRSRPIPNSLDNQQIIRRYYEDLWNRWSLDIANEIIADNITFRGSLAVTVTTRAAFLDYMQIVRTAFPDFHNTIDDLIAEGDKVAARLTYRGTHKGPLFDLAPTNRSITYTGLAHFTLRNGQITDGFVIGDTTTLMKQLKP